MKCIHCGSDTKYPDRYRNGGKCAACQHPFAFEPKRYIVFGVGLTDGLFERVIKDVSGDGTLFFTEKQLWYEFNRRLQRKLTHIPAPYGIGATGFALGGAAALLSGPGVLLPIGILAGIGTLVAGAVAGKRNRKPGRVRVSLDEFKNQY